MAAITPSPDTSGSAAPDGRTLDRRSWRWPVVMLTGLLSFAILVGWQAWEWLDRYSGVKPLEGKDFVVSKLDVVKVALSIVAGGGALYALYLADKRQRIQELEHAQRDRAHQLAEQVAQDTRDDAAARRVTELYTKAADQLGSEKAPVRLAGLYALERLAQDNPDQRRTVINLLCAYLRMPFRELHPEDVEDIERKDPKQLDHEERIQETEVRLTAQHILVAHLRPDPDEATGQPTNPDYWPGRFPFNLTGATLMGLELEGCHLEAARFTSARFLGNTSFEDVTFTSYASFEMAEFYGFAMFTKTIFTKAAKFTGAHFHNNGSFRNAEFRTDTDLNMARFDSLVGFNAAKFCGNVTFEGTHFDGGAKFNGTQFKGDAYFEAVRFGDVTKFEKTTFTKRTTFWDTVFDGGVVFTANFANPPNFDQAQAEVGGRHLWPDGWTMNNEAAHVVTTPGAPDRERAPLIRSTPN